MMMHSSYEFYKKAVEDYDNLLKNFNMKQSEKDKEQNNIVSDFIKTHFDEKPKEPKEQQPRYFLRSKNKQN